MNHWIAKQFKAGNLDGEHDIAISVQSLRTGHKRHADGTPSWEMIRLYVRFLRRQHEVYGEQARRRRMRRDERYRLWHIEQELEELGMLE